MSYVQLTLEERYVVYHLKLFGLTIREIGRRLKRHHSTISRELKRNGARYPKGIYWHKAAHEYALERRRKPRHQRRWTEARLRRYVVRKLQALWSPELIAGRLKVDYPKQDAMRVSGETIYRWVYADARRGGHLHTCLCWRHKHRRKQPRYGSLRGLIAGRIGIAQRPAIVNARRRFGDWEGDTVYGSRTHQCLLTHVERKSRYLIAGKLNDRRAASVAALSVNHFSRLPGTWRKTLTLDNGKEFAAFAAVERATGLQVFFADPYCAWQRGTNENVNGLLRRYFPKGTDFSNVSNDQLESVVQQINNRPRKCLSYQTPLEIVLRNSRGAVGM